MSYELLNPDDLGSQVPIKGWTEGVYVEESAKRQLENIARLPFIHSHVAVMPDVHLGSGATVGSVIATRKAIIPSAVGVDIGCGMMAVRTSLMASDLPDNLSAIRSRIESMVPHGRTDNGGPNDKGAWKEYNPGIPAIKLLGRFDMFVEKHYKLRKAFDRAPYHMGTLGGGNHFIELCLDEQQRVWVMLHSGSRGIGNAIGSYFINKAKEEMQKWFIHLPDKDLAYLAEGSNYFRDYCEGVNWAQEYAKMNREQMMQAVLSALHLELPVEFKHDLEAVNCHHNYVSWERHFGENLIVTRKGAVSAQQGQLGIIPGSMGAKSFIVSGKGNRDSFCSCSHGAGRMMSRTAARKIFTVEDHAKATAGIECRKDEEVLDETPGAYKDIDKVMEAQSDLVDVVHTLRQVLCVKG